MDKGAATKTRRIANGLCVDCGESRRSDGTTTRCRSCAKTASQRATARSAKLREQRRFNRLCIRCGTGSPDSSECAPCASKRRGYVAKLYVASIRPKQSRHKEAGLCRLCGRDRLGTASLCRPHYAGALTKRYGVKRRDALALVQRLESDGFLCAYTGWAIVPGETASLDHVVPRSIAPERNCDPANLVWCHADINRMKGDMTGEQFLAVCRLLVQRAEAKTGLLPVKAARERAVEAGTRWKAA